MSSVICQRGQLALARYLPLGWAGRMMERPEPDSLRRRCSMRLSPSST
jgi:hypothetical protein